MDINDRPYINRMLEDHPRLRKCSHDILKAYLMLEECYAKGGKVLVCGNGGSAADSEHIVGELMKGFVSKRKIGKTDIERLKTVCDDWEYLSENLQGALPAISLVSQSSLCLAYINDVAPDMVFAQQVYGYGRENDVLIALSTSGNSGNVVNAVKVAAAFGLYTLGMTGESGGLLKNHCNVTICVPESEVYKVQEYHLPIYHALCAELENRFFVPK